MDSDNLAPTTPKLLESTVPIISLGLQGGAVRNATSVFEMLTSRPHLIFKEVRFCIDVVNEEKHPDKDMIEHLTSIDQSKLYEVKEKISWSTSQVLIPKYSPTLTTLHGFIYGPEHNSFTILILTPSQKIHSFIHLNDQDVKAGGVAESTLGKLRNWLTADNFEMKPPSNRLVCPKNYFETYERMKKEHVETVSAAWDMQTDPDKFIHEDIGIASYLCCLWKEQYNEKARSLVKFIDVGCGNGLLVYLLNKEGFSGIGIDVKSRNIWSTLFSNCEFKEEFFDPKDWKSYLDFNWLIGNHSDELTPWLAFVSTMISYECSFFVLPCCTWNFTEKYSRQNQKLSIYQCYLNHIEQVISEFGFCYERDVMKIPSTKRTCFVSKGRKYPKSDYHLHKEMAIKVVKSHSKHPDNLECVVRSSAIAVTNGTKVDRCISGAIVKIATQHLLRDVHADDPVWSPGQTVHIKELVELIKGQVSFGESLKNQNGGIQTVLRNHHQIFLIIDGGVSLRDWSQAKNQRRQKTLKRKYDKAALSKSKMCWFHENHPQGCNLSSEQCTYAHSAEELRVIEFESKSQRGTSGS